MAFATWNCPTLLKTGCKHCNPTIRNNNTNRLLRVIWISRFQSVNGYLQKMVVKSERATGQSFQEVVIGNGRIGSLLARAPGMKEPVVVTRGESIPADGYGPIYVCTRNDDLDSIVARTPSDRRPDLVFIQNGMIQTFLEERNIQNNTQALIYFAVASKGDSPVDGGGTVVYGKWAEAFAQRVCSLGCKCSVVEDKTEFIKKMVEKLLWICVMGPLCATSHFTCGQVVANETCLRDLEDLVNELKPIAEEVLRIKLDDGVVSRIVEYSNKVSDYRAGVKEIAWRNGWFLERKKTPLHVSYMKNFIG
ncbi:hypothetical protein Gasu2_27200 [Galdieria sulphuraria]|uniref:Ketopantoate reductase C-terminal domain-containing protein n=1 Tax=Galdieria sulphuraria TaxID=130081 RepID=M2Y352_GALSU|nr:uncharacterized protein Gasu_24020 [Galdieria sulphuraria]EME30249.1 hypothetical protein Gasu_24020 [Galdieria sulphuraria]GJD08416.1 hypothetical protein Gasu2_27200 [Galdieria sulphuraria]|eukprot:XP_005706769.1 hypothetical protein Gasu_24020 [Galdieria sulphuraria]